MKAVIEIEMDNAAFGDTPEEAQYELARVLKRLSGIVADSAVFDQAGVYDINGNNIGSIRIL